MHEPVAGTVMMPPHVRICPTISGLPMARLVHVEDAELLIYVTPVGSTSRIVSSVVAVLPVLVIVTV